MASHSRSSSPTTSTTEATPQRFTIITSPALALPESYTDAALLHVLATHPDAVIPPGKSLRAALLRPDADVPSNSEENTNANAPQSLQSTVEKIVHRAFWDEARESLSDPSPTRQLARLRLLYNDLHAALEGLLPGSHPSYVTLTEPLSPTPDPLSSARRHLIALTSALQERCAPVRDARLSSVRSLLEDSSPELASCIIQAIKELLEISEVMKKDLAHAMMSAVRDEDLEHEVVRMARAEEVKAVLEIYGAHDLRERWKTWLAGEDTESNATTNTYKWERRLVKALGADVAISCPLPVPNGSDTSLPASMTNQSQGNAIPPVFALSASDLFHLQNHFQALVIAAVLRTLVPLQPTPNSDSSQPRRPPSPPSAIRSPTRSSEGKNEENSTFVERVLALLMIEVDESSEDAGTTKLVNLADEVLREHRRLKAHSSASAVDSSLPEGNRPPPPPPIDEQTLRSRVDALLKPTNPVFILLRKRLLTTLSDSLVTALQTEAHLMEKEKGRRVPDALHTGRNNELARETKRPRIHLSSPSGANTKMLEKGHLRRVVHDLARTGKIQAKGYEDPILVRGIGSALAELADVVEWVRDTWAGVGLGLEGLDGDASIDKRELKGEDSQRVESNNA